MTVIELAAAHLKGELDTLKWHVGDFAEGDFYVRPCPGANHALWQIGHVISSTASMLAQVDGSFKPPFPEELTAPFKAEGSAKWDEPGKFPKPAALLEAINLLAESAAASMVRLPPEVLHKPSPDWAKDWAPTMGRLLVNIGTHVAMHYGQFQVIRRKLGKPHLM